MKEKNLMSDIFPRAEKRGFTLAEILIGVAIFALILMMLNEFMMHSRRQTENVFQKGDNLREARLALQWFETDVRNSTEVKEFDETPERITMTLKHAKEVKINVDPVASDPMVYNYITYTFYLKAMNANGDNMKPMTLARDVSDTEPAQGALASKNILLKSYSDNLTANPIGVLPSYDYAVDGVGTVKKESRFFAIDKNYYFNKMWDDAVPLAQKDEMVAKASFKGKLNGAEVGYTDLKSTVGVWLQFIVGDNNKNVYYFNEIVYMRSKI